MTSIGLAVALLALTVSCTQEMCDCPAAGLHLTVPSGIAEDVESVVITGPGCSSDRTTCNLGPSTKCTSYFIPGVAAGLCHIEVTYKSHAPTFRKDVTFEYQGGGCCGGFYPKETPVVTVTSIR